MDEDDKVLEAVPAGEPSECALSAREVLFGYFLATVEKVLVNDNMIRLSKLHNGDAPVDEKFNVKIPYVEIRRMSTSCTTDAVGGRYLSLELTQTSTRNITSALKFDATTYMFLEIAGRMVFYFKTDETQFLALIKRWYLMQTRRNLQFVNLAVLDYEFNRIKNQNAVIIKSLREKRLSLPRFCVKQQRGCNTCRTVDLYDDGVVVRRRAIISRNNLAVLDKPFPNGSKLIVRIKAVLDYAQLANYGFALGISLLQPAQLFSRIDYGAMVGQLDFSEQKQLNINVLPNDFLMITRLNSGHIKIRSSYMDKPIMFVLSTMSEVQHLYPYFVLNGTASGIEIVEFNDGHGPDTRPVAETLAQSARDERCCVVCLDSSKTVDTVLLNCRHMHTCNDCANAIKSSYTPHCPVCRAKIQSILKVFVN